MTAITFPNSPSSGDTHTAGNGIVYTYDGEKWTSIGTNSAGTWTRSGTEVSLTNAGDDLNVDSGTLFVDASTDRVGVGTSSPSSNLHVQEGAGQTATLNLNNSDGNGTLSQINLGYTADPDHGNIKYTGDIVFSNAANTERMRIDNSGNVGIGTTSPSRKMVVSSGGAEGVELSPGEAANNNLTLHYNRSSSVYTTHEVRAAQHIFSIDSTEKLRLDSSGRLLVGTTTEGISSGDNLTIADSGNCGLTIRSGTSSQGNIFFSDGTSGNSEYDGFIQYQQDTQAMLFSTGGGTQRMRILNNGVVRIMCDNYNATPGSGNSGVQLANAGTASVWAFNNTSTATHILFGNANGYVGSIQTSGTSTLYNTGSDYRLKENVVDITDGISRVKQLQPKRFNFIADADTIVDGFLAHEAQAVVPEAVSGTKDEVEVWKETDELPEGVSVGDDKLDEDGNTIPVMQYIDQSKLVPLLTAALQEAIAKIETLEAKVAALEAS